LVAVDTTAEAEGGCLGGLPFRLAVGRVVHAAQVDELLEAEGLVVAQGAAGRDDLRRWDGQRQLAEGGHQLEAAAVETLLEGLGEQRGERVQPGIASGWHGF